MNLFLWFLLLVVQTAAFTWVSRARNSGSIGYHALASVASNGIWFCSQLLLIGFAVRPGLGAAETARLGLVYIAATVTGAVSMHWIALRYMEKGKRKVGGV